MSLGLHPDTGLAAPQQVRLLLEQARAAEAAGFDGVTLSEHHANFTGYLPQPLLACGWVLEATESIWAAPAPLLLGLRHAVLVAEELCWTAARHPGRVALAVASGYAASDLELVGFDPARRTERFREQQALLMDVLGGRHAASADAAIARVDGATRRRCSAPRTAARPCAWRPSSGWASSTRAGRTPTGSAS